MGIHVEHVNWKTGKGVSHLFYSIIVNCLLLWIFITLDPLEVNFYIKNLAKYETLFGLILHTGYNPVYLTSFAVNILHYFQYGPEIVQTLDSIHFQRVYLSKSKYESYLLLAMLCTFYIIFYGFLHGKHFLFWPSTYGVVCWTCIFMMESRQFLICLITHYCMFAIWQLLKQLERQLDRYHPGKENMKSSFVYDTWIDCRNPQIFI